MPPIGGLSLTLGTAPAIGGNAAKSAPVRRADRTHTDIQKTLERLGFVRRPMQMAAASGLGGPLFGLQHDARKPVVAALPPHTTSSSEPVAQAGLPSALPTS